MSFPASVFFKSRLFRFGLVGLVGFLIEASLLTYFANQPRVGPIYGRLISFPAAVFTTWILNRKITFKSKNSPGAESVKYLVVQTVGACANLILFYILVSRWTFFAQEPVVPLLIAAVLGFAVNFVLSKKLVFK